MKLTAHLNTGLKLTTALLALAVNFNVHAVIWPNTPSGATTSAIPMTMLVAGKDHKLFYEAYNDASDIDGDGTLDTRFKPGITYYGLFDSTYCYQYSTDNNRFEPAAIAGALGVCTGSVNYWSGNWLNYLTTSRIDALRKVLYGGYREVDTTSETVLRRAYVPQDAHSWGKEYTSTVVDGYDIADYTPFSAPTATNRRHFFGNLTPNRDTNCSTLDTCSSISPRLRVRTNVGDNRRIWEWASKERPVLHDALSSGGFPAGTDAEVNYRVRVLVCTGSYHNGCKQYPNGSTPVYKPIGLLHEYGENNSMLFGLLTGSYDKHMSGGRLRKVVSSFANEVDSVTGQFNSTAPIVNTFDRLRIRGFNQSSNSGEYWKSNPYEDSAKAPTEGQLVDWGNPIGEMLYEATRYFAGKSSATGTFTGGVTVDTAVGLSSATWDDPYSSTSTAKSASCSKASFLTISDVNPSFDSNQMPGSYFDTTFTGDLTGLNVTTRSNNITAIESNITGLRFIGESNGVYDSAPSAKNVTSLGTIRGLAPEEPSKQGSYYSAAMAYYAKTTDLRASGSTSLEGTQTIDNYVVALSSPLPRIEAKLPNGKVISLVPFSKTVGGSGVSNTKGNYQPTNQIVDFYVETIANSGAGDANASINGGRYYAEFQINFEDVEQGGDHDMDAISRYIVMANADNTLSVNVIPTYQAGGMQQNMGYVISGTNRDGVYLVARDQNDNPAYFLNVPPGRSAGYCDATTMPAGCAGLPTIGGTITNTFVFSPGTSGTTATLLKDPLWYAAKYGGFVDRNGSKTPDLPLEWDADSNGVPDTYFLVQNPLKLREALKKAFDGIIEKSGSGGNVIANSTVLSTDALVYQATFNSSRWSGDLEAYPVSAAGVGSIATWKASENVPAPASRKIFFRSDAITGPIAESFEWANLSTSEKALLNDDSNVLNYVRGIRTSELQNGGTFRDRPSTNVLGDITHSSPFYVKDNDTVFIGANDGMLHAFDSKTGVERFAFMPSSSLPGLVSLTRAYYNESHRYFVDGDSAISSRTQTSGNNYLVSTLGRGGKGLFGLNVTNPSTFAASDVLWEYMSATDLDLGHMLGRPVIAKMKNDEWAAIVGNGYNSANGNAVLYILNLTTGSLITKIDTGVGGDNGLATPGVRLDTDGKAMTVYAGDLKGNLWEFDVSGTATSTWVISNSGTAFFQALDSAGNPQPITAPVTMAVNSVSGDPHLNKLFVYVGTGSDFQVADSSTTQTQTWYGLIDEGAVISGRGDLVTRTVTVTGTLGGKPVRVFGASVAGDMTGKKGFALNLPESGERIVTAANYYKLAEHVLLASSIVPVVDVCEPGGKGYLNAINAFTGARLTQPFFDVTDNGSFTDDVLSGGYIGSVDLGVGKPGESILIGNRLAVGGSKGIIEDVRVNKGTTPVKGRLSWREIVRD